MRGALARLVQMVIILHFDIRHIGKVENDSEDNNDDGDGKVWDPKICAARTLTGGILRIEKHSAGNWTTEQADAIARLSQINSRRGVLNWPKDGGIRVGDCFKKG